MPQITLLPLMGLVTVTGSIIAKALSYNIFSTICCTYGIVLPLYVVIYLSWIYPFYVSPLRKVPTVPGFPLWGQFFIIITEECGVPQRRWHEKHGLIVRYFFPFGAERLSVADDDALKHMCNRNPYNYPKPLRAKLWMMQILGEGILLVEGQQHVHQRKALAPGFSISSIRTLAPVFWKKSLLLSNLWSREVQSSGSKGSSIEALEWLNRTTLDIIGEAGFGTNINSLEHPEVPIREAYRLVFAFDLGSRALHGLQAFIPATKHIPAKMTRDMKAARNIILKMATDIVDKRIDENQDVSSKSYHKSKDIISLVIRGNERMKTAGEQGLTLENMRDQIMTFLGAGHDTTATGVAWTLHLLSTRPDVQEKLRREIFSKMPFLFDLDRRNNSDEWNTVDPDQLPYLDNVCRESLRYIPPIPMTVRQSIADDKLAGYHIPAGTVTYVFANVINHLPEYWGPTSDQFDPDRWDNLPETWVPNAYMTFLQGPRGCIGKKFAETEMKILLCCLLSFFSFQRDNSVQDPEELKMWRLVLRPRDGILIKVNALE